VDTRDRPLYDYDLQFIWETWGMFSQKSLSTNSICEIVHTLTR